MCKERNVNHHGPDNTEKEWILVEQVIRRIDKLYIQRDKVLPHHKQLFYSNLTEYEEKEETSIGLQ